MLAKSDFQKTVQSQRYHKQQKLSQASSFPIRVALLTDMNLIVRYYFDEKLLKVVTQNKYCYNTEISVEILYKAIKFLLDILYIRYI